MLISGKQWHWLEKVTPGHFGSLGHSVIRSLCHSFMWWLITSFTLMSFGHSAMTSGNMSDGSDQKWTSDQVSEWPSDQVTEWPSDWVTKWQSDWVTVWESEKVREWLSKGVTRWLNDRKWLPNKAALQAAGSDPSRCNSTNRKNPHLQ